MSLPQLLSQCFHCNHFRPGTTDNGPSCGAFPTEIPDRILHGLFDHRYSLGGEADPEIRFEPSSDEFDGWYSMRTLILGSSNETARKIGSQNGRPVTAYDVQAWASGPKVMNPIGDPHPNQTIVWGTDPVESYPAFMAVGEAVELAVTATVLCFVDHPSQITASLNRHVSQARIDWLHEKLAEAHESEGGEEEVGPLDDFLPDPYWWESNDLYPAWPPLLKNVERNLLPAAAWDVIDDNRWEHDTGEGDFFRIDDPDLIVEIIQNEGIRLIQDEDLIRRAAGPMYV